MLCVKSCLRPLHNYLEIDGIVPPIRKKIIGFLNDISHADFEVNVRFFQYVQSFISFYNKVLI